MPKLLQYLLIVILCLISIRVSAEGYKSEPFSQELLKKAEAGDLNAQLHIADCYENGLGIEKNKEKADFWFKKLQEEANKKAASINKTLEEVQKTADKVNDSMKKIAESAGSKPNIMTPTESKLKEIQKQLQFYKDLKPDSEEGKKSRQDMINQLITEENRLSDQLFQESQTR